MKKLLLLTILSTLSMQSAQAGTNAAATFNTNTYMVSPTNLWRSNSVALIDALTNAGFGSGSGGGSGGTNTFAVWTNSGNISAGSNIFATGAISSGASVLGGTLYITNNGAVNGALSVGSISGNGAALTNVAVSNLWNPTFQDNRTVTNLCYYPAIATTNIVLMSNNGPGTITRIELSAANMHTNKSPTLRIIVDGTDAAQTIYTTGGQPRTTNNGVSVWSFLCAQGWPTVGNQPGTNIDLNHQSLRGGNIDISACYLSGNTLTLTGARNLYVNFKTNCIVEITNTYTDTFYPTTYWKTGSPVTQGTWHAVEIVNTNAGTNIFTGGSVGGTAGQLESFYWFMADAGAFGYVTPPILLNIDTATVPLGAGTEDSFGGSWTWNNGFDKYFTAKWGTVCSPFFQNLSAYDVGMQCGNSSYRFFTFLPEPEPKVYFTNSLSWTFDPTTGSEVDYAIGLTTYYTIP